MGDESTARPPAEPAAAERQFPCASCGAKLTFDPAAHALKCPYCGRSETIEVSQSETAEHALDDYLEQRDQVYVPTGRVNEAACKSCGAVVLLKADIEASHCPYCGGFLQNRPAAEEGLLAPDSVVPFTIDKQKAVAVFCQWVNRLWFAPNELKQYADLGRIDGLYVPFWSFAANTQADYLGERGVNYMVTQTVYVNGQPQTRQVVQTNWTPVSGTVTQFFAAIPVCGSSNLPTFYARTLSANDLQDAEPFREEFLSGFTTERYSLDPKMGFVTAEAIINDAMRGLCIQNIGGDQQRLTSMRTQHSDVKFKHTLVPVWVTGYRYRDNVYRITVNGRSGQVIGERPYSWLKIALLVLVILAGIGALIAAIVYFSGRGGTARGPGEPDQPRAALAARAEPWRGPSEKRINWLPPGENPEPIVRVVQTDGTDRSQPLPRDGRPHMTSVRRT
jgi:predicted RNA-binding Zn-ribbon protein involved in translation (DUF1610 family)